MLAASSPRAIAPTSDAVYYLELLRAIALGDETASMDAARRAIEDDVDNRMFAFGGAVQHMLNRAADDGTYGEASAWLDAQAPGLLDVDGPSDNLKYRDAQFVALDAWFTVLPREEMLRRLHKLHSIAETYGIDPLEKPMSRVRYMALTGKAEEAIDVALADVFTQSVASNLRWKETFTRPLYSQVVADERVEAALSSWEDEWLALQTQVRGFLEDLSVNSMSASVRR